MFKAFSTRSPTCKLGVVVDGVSVRIEMISPAAWRRKSSSFTSGYRMLDGDNVIVSQSLVVLVRGKYHVTHLECFIDRSTYHPASPFNSQVLR